LHGCCAFRTDEVSKLAEQSTFRRLLAKGETRDSDHHDEDRRKRENGVIRDCRTHRRGTVVEPGVNGFRA
jgi:hypothetical protein